jgi:hypothetical protein
MAAYGQHVSRTNTDPLAGVSWRTSGRVVIDSGSVALGDPETLLAMQSAGSQLGEDIVLDGSLACWETLDDVDCPVEKGLTGQEIVAVRIETVSDVAKIAGSWDAIGELRLDRPQCVVADPRSTPIAHALDGLGQLIDVDTDLRTAAGVTVGCVLHVPIGRYHVEVFNTEDGYNSLGIRLRRVAP